VIKDSQTISDNAVKILDDCLVSYSGFTAVVIPASGLSSFAIQINNSQTGDNHVTITNLSTQPSGGVSCDAKLNKPQTVPFAVLCQKPEANTVQVVMNTNRGDLKPVEVYGKDRVIPDMQNDIQALASQWQALSGQVQHELLLVALPKGTIVAWGRKNQPVPKGWVACDGSNSDCPNLTDRFLRGTSSDQVGNMGGNDSHIHQSIIGDEGRPDGSGYSKAGSHYQGTTDPQPNVPKYMSVLYIMKISE
jgi:hypothetical protein